MRPALGGLVDRRLARTASSHWTRVDGRRFHARHAGPQAAMALPVVCVHAGGVRPPGPQRPRLCLKTIAFELDDDVPVRAPDQIGGRVHATPQRHLLRRQLIHFREVRECSTVLEHPPQTGPHCDPNSFEVASTTAEACSSLDADTPRV